MIASVLSLVVEGIVSILLIVMIVYASRLNGRLASLRAQENELQEGIARFNEAAVRAEAAAARLKAVGSEAERTVRAAFDRAQAIRDELTFLVDRGDVLSRRTPSGAAPSDAKNGSESNERLRRELRSAPSATAAGTRNRAAARAETSGRKHAEQDHQENDTAALRSAAERELLRAIRAAHGAK
jgi:hypothetical protein